MMYRVRLLTYALAGAGILSGCSSTSDNPPQEPAQLAMTQSGSGEYRMTWDDFSNGFTTGADGKWFYWSAGPYVGDDGIAMTRPRGGLRVKASGTNAVTGEPAFTKTVGQEGAADNPYKLPGGVDHVKWLVFMNQFSSASGGTIPGFDAIEGHELSCEINGFSGRSYGVSAHPFGNDVANSNTDLRLGASAMNAVDFETFMVFDFFVTNEMIYAFYERLPFGRTSTNHYASFSFQIPVAARNKKDEHDLKISYDKSRGIVKWSIDGKEVYEVGQIGKLIDRQYLTIDHGGTEELVRPAQLACGMGMFTLLDGALPSKKALVRLSTAENFYFDTTTGSSPQKFVDDLSQTGSRLFGQGAELNLQEYLVSSKKIK